MGQLQLWHKGKVRDVYDFGQELLLVATDRISAFDRCMPSGVPGKGKFLTQVSQFWFNQFQSICAHHMISTRMEDMPVEVQEKREQFEGRSMLVKKCRRIDVECIVRGYITGSGWKSYQSSGHVCGVVLPSGLKRDQKLETPIFTPTSKSDSGDEAMTFEEMKDFCGAELAENLKNLSLRLYQHAFSFCWDRGLILCDTKFEFGFNDEEEICLIDEVITPDSSRFWQASRYVEGEANESFDKQVLRNYLLENNLSTSDLIEDLPDWLVDSIQDRYRYVSDILMGQAND